VAIVHIKLQGIGKTLRLQAGHVFGTASGGKHAPALLLQAARYVQAYAAGAAGNQDVFLCHRLNQLKDMPVKLPHM
jgi:hypothetical protein